LIELIDEKIFQILNVLYENGELTNSELINKIKGSDIGIYRRIKILKDKNLIFRRVERDRSVHYWIGFSGRLVLESMRAIKEYSKEIQVETKMH
jgi:predicted transcriptional regulator